MDLVYRVGLRINEVTKAGMRLSTTTHLARALAGANYCIASIGVHGPKFAWHKLDCDVVAKFGIMQTTGDTVGPSGVSQGLRIIPIFLQIARAMEKYCPDAVLLNHSNPMGAICRAVSKYTKIRIIGYCHNVASDLMFIGRILKMDHKYLEPVFAGPNHCVWMWGLKYRGRDIFPLLKRRLADFNAGEPLPPRKDGTGTDLKGHKFAADVMALLNVFPVGGDRHLIEFFPHARQATSPRRLPYELQWRSEMIRDNRLKAELNSAPAKMRLKAAGKHPVWLPDPKQPTPENMGQQIRALRFGPAMMHTINVANRGAVPNLPDWAVIELRAEIGLNGTRPLVIGEMPAQVARWSVAQIYAHELTIDAAAEGSREKAVMAMAADPMIRDFDEAQRVFDAIVKAQGPRMKAFRA
jgi:alpha-galactosidase